MSHNISALIVEDNTSKLNDIVNVLTKTLLLDFKTIEVVQDAFNARKKLEEKGFDILILDLSIPESLGNQPDPSAGLRLLDDIHNDDTYNTPTRIIGVTGYGELANSFTADFNAYGVVLVKYDSTSTTWEAPLSMQVRQVAALAKAATVTKTFQNYLGIVCALDDEFDAVQKLPWNFEEVTLTGDPTLYIQGSFIQKGNRLTVVAALCPRVGMSAAAITAIKLIEGFRPKILAMTGITGALRGQANLCDIIVAEETWDWGMGKWSRKKSSNIFSPSPHHITLDADLRSAAARLSRNEKELLKIREEWHGEKPSTIPKLLIGPVASGSAVISTQDMSDTIAAQHRKLLGIEMESYGLYAAAAEATFPRPVAISIKAVSDFADENKGDNWRYYCCYASAKVLKAIVENGL